MTDDEYSKFQAYLAENPLIGNVIPASGGLRKLRWKAKSKGKRGGVRIIYYNLTTSGKICLMTIYAKNEMENLTKEDLLILRNEVPQ